MVLSEKNPTSLKNGQRSRGSSPNGNGPSNPDSLSDEEGGVEKIHVGKDFQAVCPDYIPQSQRRSEREVSDRALLVWSPSGSISDEQLDEYIQIAKEKYGYNGEQALGMLFWHKHDLEKAVLDLANFTPFPDEWTVEDKVLFEQAFTFHGKTFHRIKQMLPDKSMGSLVKYYYSWKKTRAKTSLIDRQAKKLGNSKEETSELGSEQGSNSDTDTEDKKENSDVKEMKSKSYCSNCGIPCTLAKTTPKGLMCKTCFIHWRKTGSLRPTLGPLRGRDRHCYNVLKNKSKPPRGMHIDHEDLVTLSSPHSQNTFVNLDREISSLKRQVQNNKQILSGMKRKLNESLEDLRPPERDIKVNSRWSNDELLLAVQAVRKFGKNEKAIADVMGTKTEAHVRQFFQTYRKKYNLDLILKEYHAENGSAATVLELVDEKDNKYNKTTTVTNNSITNTTSAGVITTTNTTDNKVRSHPASPENSQEGEIAGS